MHDSCDTHAATAELDDVGYLAAAREPTACVLAVAGSLGGHVEDDAGAVYR